MALKLEMTKRIASVDAVVWDALVNGMPLLSHAFLNALELSGSVGEGSGWYPSHMLVYDDAALVGAMPLYLKTHSYGEYVFDWAWAEAFERNGLDYYPKLVSAIPFTPITSAKMLTQHAEVSRLLIQALAQMMQKNHLSSAHVLFPDDASAQSLRQAGWLERNGVQFRWENESFQSFDDFLSRLNHAKRKKIRQERAKVTEAGVVCRQIKGADISPEQWDFFYQCYENTYYEHRSTPYLTRSFFQEIGNTMPQNILLVIAYLNDAPIAAAFNIYHDKTLYGRYWGAVTYIPNLHFELCYYQGQAFCIAENIHYFEGGAQGEHKLARGFKPRLTRSFHAIDNADFSKAIQDFILRESQSMASYTNELDERAPFKKLTVD